ncbi:unnamed protein product [Rotaria socialis]|uniref:Uncharacterized protein n=1 Tax=Rotaria socialis TaxID=392032 RepID=A0A817WHS1_9BILA|nr:unnamed protein product [Rotaria socialis]CAF4106524.1 unnamed protein product [Rotaria socialis]
MVSESFDLSTTDPTMITNGSKKSYHVKKPIFWAIVSGIVAIFITLLVLTIYFGVNQKVSASKTTATTVAIAASTTTTTTTTTATATATASELIETTTLAPPIERIPTNLRQEEYRLTLFPNLTSETFTGILFYTFTCLETTNEVVLHQKDLLLNNSTIKIVNSSLTDSPLPVLDSWSYDEYSELIRLKFSSSFIPNHNYTLYLTFSANISRELHGLYVSKYIDTNGITKTFMTSQMEPTHARTVFPCIDEPARKAIFYISVIHDSSERVWSNGEIQRTEILDNGKLLSHFTPTLKMSTFLLAIIVASKSDFDCRPESIVGSTNISSRVCGRIDILPQLAYADEIASKSLVYFNEYFDILYPLPKLEHFAVPDFGAGAMENYGLAIYREVGLFYDENTVSASRKQYITTVVTHEIAHQWFGNLVSPAWWGELWLKEGFASYMETLASDRLEPAWMQDERIVVEKIFPFMDADSLPTSRPISIQSTNPADIFQLFDSITYDKGATLIRMMSMFLGAQVFQKGIQNYLKALSYSSATQEDLWRYLSHAADNKIDVEQIMNGWTKQAGYPIVEINREYAKQTERQQKLNVNSYMVINQKPFSLFSTTVKREKWWIPFKHFDRSSAKTSSRNSVVWLNDTSMRLQISTSDSDWILANPDYLGIYRTKYDSRNFRLIINQLLSDHTRIPTITRGALIDDVFALSRTSLVNTSDAYELIRYLKDEVEFVPWTAAFSAMRLQEDLLTGQEILLDVQQYFLELLLPLYHKIGWEPIDQSKDWLRALLQPSVLSAACRYGHRECVEEARKAYRRWLSNPALNQIPATLRSTVYCTIIREGSQSEFYFLWDRLKQENVASETLNLLNGLSCTQDPSLILWFLNQHLKINPIIRDQDLATSIQRVARSSHGNQIAWNWIRDNWDQLFSKWGKSGSSLSGIMEAVSSRFINSRQRDEFVTFANSISDKGTSYRQFQLSLDKIDAAIEWNRINLNGITSFLHPGNTGPDANSHRLPSLAIPIHYNLYVKPYLNISDSNVRYSVFEADVNITIKIIQATDRIVLHKRFIVVRYPITLSIPRVSVMRTIYDNERDFFTIIFNQTLLNNTEFTLMIPYIGELRNDTFGFYLSSYLRSTDQVRRYLVASQMEPISARRALPCFDEPALKATYTIIVEHEQHYRAWSNMPIASTQNQLNGWTITQFEKSVPMSSYLLALVVADFECLVQNNTGHYRNITTSICAQPEKKNELYYALKVATKNIEDFEEQYKVNFPISKVDHIAVPDFDAGAMENFGCIIYRETRLFYNNRTSTSSNKQDVALVIAHELAHQWFGDLVSPSWWDDLWLNEGFAKWMEFVYTDKIHPEWDLYEQFIAQRWLAVMQNDAISFSHPVNMKITQNEQLTSIFDAITYSKGSSLLRMMRNFMGIDTFNRGISKYLSQHLFSTARQMDLWKALGEQMHEDNIQLPFNTSLSDIMSTWTNQMGYPYVEIIRDYEHQSIKISQKQFLFDSEAQPSKSPYNYIWSIPLKIKSPSSLSTDLIWFSKTAMSMTTNVQSNEWILVNPELLGFFRANYDRENWKKIIQQFKTDHQKFSIVERSGLIDDAFNLARPNILSASLVFELLEYSPLEGSYIVWERILSGLQYIEQMIASSSSGLYLYERFRSYVVDLILPIYNKLGWHDNQFTDKWLDTLHRDMIVSTACRYDLDHCIKRAQDLFEQWFNSPSNNTIEPNQRRVVYCTSIRLGDRARFQFLLREYQASNDPQEKARIQAALTCTRDIELIRYLLHIHINTEQNIIRRQDVLGGIRLICRNLIAETECWTFVRSRWTQLFLDYGGSLSFAELIKDVTGRFNTLLQLEEFERFTEQITDKGAAETEFKSSIERIRANIQWVSKSKPNLEEWFLNRTLAIRLPLDWFPSRYQLNFDVFLKSIYPNNAEPNTTFLGHTRIRIRCARSTNELRIHMKKLRLSYAILTRVGTKNNLISDWTLVTSSEVLLCRLRERCTKGEEYEFEAAHTAELDREMAGFYLSRYNVTNTTTNQIITHNIGATHMQPTIARQVFPCFDEPLFKANFTISITYDPSFTVVRSNGAMLNNNIPEVLSNGRLLARFEQTPPMSTYLVAFVLTDFQCITNLSLHDISVSVCGRQEAITKGDGDFALDVAAHVITYFEQSYNVPYPLSKCDHFAIPDFSAGAMENWGLITYRETALLYNSETGNLANKLRVGEVVSHEIAHQWFGNIVTPKWWNDIWLNEGFASWVEVIALNNANPEFEALDVFVTTTVQRALVMDSLYSSHPISVEVTHPDEINSIFDAISYDKGASILRMIYSVLNETTFFQGISNYLDYFKYNNAVQDELWAFLTNVTSPITLGGYTVKQIMDTWTLQEGYPVLMVTRNYNDNTLILKQKRFLLDPNAVHNKSSYVNPFKPLEFQWYIPYDYMIDSTLSTFYWLSPNKTVQLTDIRPSNDWILFNTNEFGFYRVNYDDQNWKLLINSLKNNVSEIPIVSRAQLIDDSFSLTRSGDLNVTIPLDLSVYLCHEINYIPFSAFSTNLQYLTVMFGQNESNIEYQQLQKYIRTIEEPAYVFLGWSIAPSTSDYLSRQLRSLIISDLCSNGHEACIREAILQYQLWRQNPTTHPINPDFRTTVYCQGIKNGTVEDYLYIQNQYKQTNDQVEKNRLGFALTCTRNATLLEKLLNETLTNDYIRLQDSSSFIGRISVQPGGQKLTWRFISQRWSELVSKLGGLSFTLSNIVENILQYINTQYELDIVQNFMIETENLSIAERAFLSSVEKIKANIRWMDTTGRDIRTWLSTNTVTC